MVAGLADRRTRINEWVAGEPLDAMSPPVILSRPERQGHVQLGPDGSQQSISAVLSFWNVTLHPFFVQDIKLLRPYFP